jgi:hypothetical protein
MKRISTGFLILALALTPTLAHAHRRHWGPRMEPPPPREETYRPRAGYVWVGGYHRWRGNGYVWAPGHYARERPGREWRGPTWERHEDHYDWRRGGWHPVR